MLCKPYDELSHQEKIVFIGRVVHAIQNDEECFILAERMTDCAADKGLFNNVKILPSGESKEDSIENTKY